MRRLACLALVLCSACAGGGDVVDDKPSDTGTAGEAGTSGGGTAGASAGSGTAGSNAGAGGDAGSATAGSASGAGGSDPGGAAGTASGAAGTGGGTAGATSGAGGTSGSGTSGSGTSGSGTSGSGTGGDAGTAGAGGSVAGNGGSAAGSGGSDAGAAGTTSGAAGTMSGGGGTSGASGAAGSGGSTTGCPLPADACVDGAQSRAGCDGARIVGRKNAKNPAAYPGQNTCSANDSMNTGTCIDSGYDHTYRIFLRPGEKVTIAIASTACFLGSSSARIKVHRSTDGCGTPTATACTEASMALTCSSSSSSFTATTEGWYVIVVDGNTPNDGVSYDLSVFLDASSCVVPGCECP